VFAKQDEVHIDYSSLTSYFLEAAPMMQQKKSVETSRRKHSKSEYMHGVSKPNGKTSGMDSSYAETKKSV
jgi:hypothetical protein